MQKRVISITVSIIVLLSLVFSVLQVTPVIAQDGSVEGIGGNPVQPDENATQAATKPTLDKSSLDPSKKVRVIVQLADTPVASYAGGVQGFEPTSIQVTGAASLNLAEPNAVSYERYLKGKQTTFTRDLKSALPNAEIGRAYQVVLNALTITTTAGDIQRIREIPGVKSVTLEQEHKLQMDSSLPLIGLGSGTVGGGDWSDSGLWESVGGHANAGAGLRIADIDSGITPDNPCFDPAGYTYPSGYPQGETNITNGKIIVARSYFRADDPPFFPATALDDPGNYEGGHGTHTAGTIACNYGSTSTFNGIKISGVAPKAQLLVYKVFYYSMSGSHSAFTPELIAAIEDAVRDGAQVVNNSWGGPNINTVDDPEVAAYEAASDAGVVIVFAAGNEGPGDMTIGSPGANSEKFITVAASTTARTFVTTLENTARSDSGTSLPIINGRSLTQAPVTAPIVDLQVAGYGDSIACNGAVPSSIANGKIVVVRRGTCALVDKVAFAKAGGAVGVVIRNVAGGATTLPLINPVLPTIHISQTDGDTLRTWLAALPGGVTATFRINGPATVDPAGDAEDTLASFSSIGPTPDLQLKPDISAPGVNILSSVSPMEYGSTTDTFDFYQGTSMAAPHVTGAAALLKQANPSWTPAEIKSALMTTAEEPASLGDNPAYRGAGRLNLSGPDKVELTFDHPSLSFGLSTIGVAKEITVTAKNMTSTAVTYNFTVGNTSGPAPVILDDSTPTTSLTVPANGMKAFKVRYTPTAAEDAYGSIIMTKDLSPSSSAQSTLHLPYFSRSVDGGIAADVYLVDGDSSPLAGCTNYASVYQAALTEVGLTYSYVDYYTDSFDFNQARLHDLVIYFEGDPGCNSNAGAYLSYSGSIANDLRNYLAQGGKMLIMGQDIGYWDNRLSANLGLSFNPALFFGASYVQDNLLNGAPLLVAGDGDYSPFLGGVVLPLDDTNTISVDELAPKLYNDADAFPIFSNKSAPAANGYPYKGGMGTRMSSEPTIERVKGAEEWTQVPYRTIFTSFGLENIKEGSGTHYRAELVELLAYWFYNQTSVAFDSSVFFSPNPSVGVTLSGHGDASFGDIVYYRVDFGDGSPIEVVGPGSSGEMSVNHKYETWGDYKVYIEAVDIYGQKAVSSATAKVGYIQYMPLISK